MVVHRCPGVVCGTWLDRLESVVARMGLSVLVVCLFLLMVMVFEQELRLGRFDGRRPKLEWRACDCGDGVLIRAESAF